MTCRGGVGAWSHRVRLHYFIFSYLNRDMVPHILIDFYVDCDREAFGHFLRPTDRRQEVKRGISTESARES